MLNDLLSEKKELKHGPSMDTGWNDRKKKTLLPRVAEIPHTTASFRSMHFCYANLEPLSVSVQYLIRFTGRIWKVLKNLPENRKFVPCLVRQEQNLDTCHGTVATITTSTTSNLTAESFKDVFHNELTSESQARASPNSTNQTTPGICHELVAHPSEVSLHECLPCHAFE